MARFKEEDYAYATARIRAIEPKLMNQNKLDRLMDAASTSDAIKLLLESNYGADRPDGVANSGNDMEKTLESELKKTYKLLAEILPDKLAVDLLMRRYDYLNAKLILKGEFLGIDVSYSLSEMGLIPSGTLSRMITDRKLGDLPEIFQKALLESIESFNQTRDPQYIDLILDRASFENMLFEARQTGEPYMVQLVEGLIDTANLRSFIRARLLKKSPQFIERILVDGGRLSLKTYMDHADKPLEQFLASLHYTELADLSQELERSIKSPLGISRIEKTLDDSIMKFLRKSKYIAMGIEPVIAYLFFKETEIKNARLIITGKANKISSETIKERLRLGYA